MIPREFPEANRRLTPPPDMSEEECGVLPVWSDGKVCISCWRPSLQEKLSILFFGRVWLSVVSGGTQPPVALAAMRKLFERTTR